ncbi:UNVERIFIED_ORG: integrase [Methylobacterium sp. SuP10 SLI 274]|nr:integrase [Methylorubrum extorquens]MDF9862554.1 integrase [Methylorubrum pseudosasae]MDH6636168.1 integrase [Methylobacterium sp. SuP10 SLI 274]MDH6665341.1 integrase [Methylorubrum zatmanii]
MAKRVRYLLRRGDGFWARMAVPAELRQIVGKRELLAPLGPNQRIAERDIHGVVAVFHQTLADARAKLELSALPPARSRPRPLTLAQIAHTHYAEELDLDRRLREGGQHMPEWPVEWKVRVDGLPAEVEVPAEDEPANVGSLKSPLTLYQERAAREWDERTQPNAGSRSGFKAPSLSYRQQQVRELRRIASGHSKDDHELQAVVGWAIEKFEARGSTAVEFGTEEWRKLGRLLAQVQLEALRATIERDDGSEPASPKLPILAEPPNTGQVVPIRPRGPALPLLDLLDGYLRTKQSQGKGAEAERRWKPVFKALVRHLGHDDARHLTKSDIMGWRDHLLEKEGLAAKTVRDVHLASLRAVLGWAADNEKIPENPAARVRIDVEKKVSVRERGLNDAEAVAVLKTALAYQPPAAHSPATRESSYVTAAKRWLPWLCALTGARVAEMGAIRVQDVITDKGIIYIRITPDAGPVKSGQYRDVPVHSQLVELGFLDFVKAAGDGPLFYDAAKHRKEDAQHPSKIVAARVSTWVRSLGLIDKAVSPSHGWRHRFKTVGREAEISDRVLDALQGHAGRTAGDNYGDVTLKTRDAAIRRMPTYSVE